MSGYVIINNRNCYKREKYQTLYNLSDEKVEEARADRLSFKRFYGFAVEDVTPDKTTICRFRNSLQGFEENFLDMVNEQLDQHGMRVRKGTLVDASIVKSNAKTPTPKGARSQSVTQKPDGRRKVVSTSMAIKLM